ncbi:MAG: recombinase family protein, partial [Oligoflexia bacterium]|nr:recombinase family protein [Oligoflexia bacterium]
MKEDRLQAIAANGNNMQKEQKCAAIYICCSKLLGHNSNSQIEAIKNYCNQNSYKVLKVYVDDVVSFNDKRVALQELIRIAPKCQVQTIVVNSFNRIGMNISQLAT